MVRQDDVSVGVALHFRTPDGSPDLVGTVQRVHDGFVWILNERWPVDVVARESTIIPKPSSEHRWDGALGRWYLPTEYQPMGDGVMLGHARHG
jgi:hypothetical protein